MSSSNFQLNQLIDDFFFLNYQVDNKTIKHQSTYHCEIHKGSTRNLNLDNRLILYYYMGTYKLIIHKFY